MKTYDVIIIGGGITGVSTALHLLKRKIDRILILDPNLNQSESQKCAEFVLGGQRDNITRVAHAHGKDFAKTLWEFGDQAFLDVKKFAAEHNLTFKQGRRIRLIASQHELEEAKKAHDLFQELGFSEVHLVEKPDRSIFPESIIAVQFEGEKSATLNISNFFSTVLKTLSPMIVPTSCSKIEKLNSHWTLTDSNQNQYRSEFVVLASHLASADFVPTIASAFVSAADQWAEHELQGDLSNSFFPEGSFFSANHGLEWGGKMNEKTCRIGGARFLRPLAGFEAKVANYEKKIEGFLQKYFEERFCHLKLSPAGKTSAGLDCVPCDELPIIGPMFGESQKLIGAGYMGSGLAMGFRAGKCLAEIIATGKSLDLPRRLHPERLRSLT